MLQHRLARRAATVSFIDKALGHRWNATEHNESGRYDRCGHQLVGHRRLLLPTSQPERGAAGIEIQVPADRRKRPRHPWPRPRVDQGAPRRYESSSPLIPRRHGGHLRGVHDAGGAGGRHWSILGRVPLLLSSHGATGREFPPVDVLTSRCHRRHRLPPRPPLPPKRASMPVDVPAEAERHRRGRGAVLPWTVPGQGKGRSGGWHWQGRTAAADWRVPPPAPDGKTSPLRSYFVQRGKNHTPGKNKCRPSPLARASAQKIAGGLCYGAPSRRHGNECRK